MTDTAVATREEQHPMSRKPGRPAVPLVDRLWAKVDRSGGPDACWMWTGYINPSGYANIGAGGATGRRLLVHRIAYELCVGPIPIGMTLDHLCRIPLCANPSHLEPVTMRENTLRGVGPTARNARKDACMNGHAFDEANTYLRPTGGRGCRSCRHAWTRRMRSKAAAA